MDGIPELAADIYRKRVARARQRPVALKILDGAELFDFACEVSKAGIRSQFPDYSEDQVMQELRRRLAIGKRLEAMSAQRQA
jgi:hypothetical protein